jgi:hypothetical protein
MDEDNLEASSLAERVKKDDVSHRCPDSGLVTVGEWLLSYISGE